MLLSLSIKDFVLIEDAALDLGAGLTVLSGETGAGKTLLTQALGLLIGERAADGLVKDRSDEAIIQGIFELSPSQVDALSEDLRDLAGIQPGELVATRRLTRTGRNRCFLNGIAVPLSSMADVLGDVISFSGQHEHRRLLRAAYQLQVVDAFAGPDQERDLSAYRASWTEARRLETRLEDLRRETAELDRESALLAFQVEELEAAALDVDEEKELESTQRLLARVEEVQRACSEAGAGLRNDDAGADAAALVSLSRSRLTPFQGFHESLDAALATLNDAAEAIDDAARALRAFSDSLETDPARLREVDDRLRVYADMARKYGGTTEAAVSFLHDARLRLDAIGSSERTATEMESRLAALRHECVQSAAVLSRRRRESAAALEIAVARHLAGLGMPHGRLEVTVETDAVWEALDASGADGLEFRLAANKGVTPRSLARTASGGELSRVLLAIKTALRGCEVAETVVFDEIDAGVGGHTATAVGAKLRDIATASQVIVVTHLPQVAAFADRHYVIRKETVGETTVTRLEALDAEGATQELCRMMGGSPGDPGAMAHARSLRDRATAGLID